MTKYNYITQDQLNTCLAGYFKNPGNITFDEFFKWWVAGNIPELRAPLTRLTAVQQAFVVNVVTIFNNV